jgi:hypothetical protein
MTGGERPDRSAERCPGCGAYQLALIDFPDLDVARQSITHAALGMVEPDDNTPPAIGCLSCGAQWPDLVAFREAQRGHGD